MNVRWFTVWIAAAILLPAAVKAEEKVSIKEKERRANVESQLEETLKYANEKCSAEIKASIDWASFKGVDAGGNSISGFCEPPLNAARMLCDSSEAGREGVQNGFKKLVCKFGGAGKRAIAVKEGVVTWKIDWDAANNDDFAKEYLENNL